MARLFVAASSEYLENGAAALTTQLGTTMAWFKGTGVSQAIFAIGASAGSTRLSLALNASGQLIAQTVDTSNTGASSTSVAAVNDGAYHHLAAIFRSATDREAVADGVAGTINTTNIVLGTVNRTTVGARYVTGTRGAFLDGTVAEVAVFNTALPLAVILAIAKREASPLDFKAHGLVLYSPLWGYSSPEKDLAA
jgi:concanavalin A-like lectin/glucanase superfamily protein